MSQRQCLPLPRKRGGQNHHHHQKEKSCNKNRKKNIEISDNNLICNNNIEIDSNDNNNNDDIPNTAKTNENKKGQKVTKMSISDLSTMDPMTYLALVNAEATNLPDIFIASSSSSDNVRNESSLEEEKQEQENGKKTTKKSFIPAAIDGSAAASQYLFSKHSLLLSPPSEKYLPRMKNVKNGVGGMNRKEWIENTLANFSTLRIYLDQCRSSGLGSSQERIPVPFGKDSTNWHIFCLGKDEVLGNNNKDGFYFHDSDDDDVDDVDDENDDNGDDDDDNGSNSCNYKGNNTTNNNNPQQWNVSTTPKSGNPPTARLLCQFDQIITRLLLTHFNHYLSCDLWDMTCQRGAWIYAILARLEKPIHRDQACDLRDLLKELCRLRYAFYDGDSGDSGDSGGGDSCYNKDKLKVLATLNVLIVIVAYYFEQGGGSSDFIMKVNTDTINNAGVGGGGKKK